MDIERQHQQPRSLSSETAEDRLERDKLQKLEYRTYKIIEEIISQEERRCRAILDKLDEQNRKTLAWLNELAEKDMNILRNLCGDRDLAG